MIRFWKVIRNPLAVTNPLYMVHQNTLSASDTQRGLRLVIREGMATQTMIILTSGTLLVALALKLGATHLQVGIISSIPLFSNVCQIASIYLVQRWRRRKKVVVLGTLLGRSAYLIIALLPFVPVEGYGVYLMMGALAMQHCLGAVSNGSWSSWMRDLVPHRTMGAFFSKRLAIVQTLSVFLSAATILLLSQAESRGGTTELFAYGGLFAIGSLAGLLGTFFLSRTPEPNYQPDFTPLVSLIKLPFRHANFRQLMTYMASWNFAVNLATPFFTVYMLEKLGLSMAYVIALTTLTQVFNVFFFRRWGRYADRYSNKTVLGICAPLYLLCIGGMVFTTLPGAHAGTLPLLVLLHALMGVATAGTGLASSSIGLKLAPHAHSVAYLSMLSFTNSLAAGMAPILSGWLSGYLVTSAWIWEVASPFADGGSLSLISLQHWDFLFLLSSVAGTGALYWLSRLQEAGDASRRVLIRRWQKEIWLWGTLKLRARGRNARTLSTLTVGPPAPSAESAAQTPSQSHPQKHSEAR